MTAMERKASSTDITPDGVKNFLQSNPKFLDHYVNVYVPIERVEEWISRKTRETQPPAQNQKKIAAHNKLVEHCKDGFSSANNRQLCEIIKYSSSAISDTDTLYQLADSLHLQQPKDEWMMQVARCCCQAVAADGFRLYLVSGNEESDRLVAVNDKSVPVEFIGPGSSLAAYVAHQKESACLPILPTVAQDERFPHGIRSSEIGGKQIKSVLAVPVCQMNHNLSGVIEMYRTNGSQAFTKDHLKMAENYLMVTALVDLCRELYHESDRQKKLNDFLLNVTKNIFQDIVSIETVIIKIMDFAKRLVNADRSALFLLDHRTKEIYSRVFDMGDDFKPSGNTVMPDEIRFPMGTGVAGHVAATGEVLNITDAYQNHHFNRAIDMKTGYRTKTILCMPILIRGSIIGVVQMVNKKSGVFTKADERSFEVFAVYCGLALHLTKLYEKIRRSEQKYRVALEVLSYHAQESESEVKALHSRDAPSKEQMSELVKYDFNPWALDDLDKPLFVLHMIKELFKNNRLDMKTVSHFTLTVRKNYRSVPYHNWSHAFSVAHAMYTVLSTSEHKFEPLEGLALVVAALCHDLDHRGKTNSFMVKSETPLAALYSTSTMEHHHFNQTVAILQNEGHNIFRHLTSEEYKQVLGDVKHCILATDLASFFPNRAQLKSLMDSEVFDWSNREHRLMVMGISMTASDLCSMYKPWKLQLKLVEVIMEEFWVQGDEEKSQGITPIPMMDRDKKDQLPQSQVGFLVGICLPCYELMADLLPQTLPMVTGAKANLRRWQDRADNPDKQTDDIEDKT